MIRVENLTKYYGDKRALGPVSFEIADGETVGFLGLNGAGKTTALRILACDLRPSAGAVSIGGIDALQDPHEVRKQIGFAPETPPLYTDMNVIEYLTFAGEMRGLRGGELKKRLADVLDLTSLTDVSRQVISTLSHGYKQRVGLAQAIVHKPKFLILDEPTRGLDPVQIVEMRNLIHDLKENHTVLLSSHILTEISQTCDRLLVLGKGALLGSGSESDLAAHEGEIRQVTVAVRIGAEARKAVAELLAKVDGVSAVAEPYEQGGGVVFALSTSKDVRAEVSRAVVTAGHDLIKLDYARSELENTFIRLVGDTGGRDASN
ncbi:MAG: ATP-binding cassette domain-containing protein [Kofleriaceae bacterium]|jgi:ABC-2 type transport system ATP-binding protein|nr:ATP-binding cassette domain-containing protein [Kofleriaceae bacterium]MBP6837314.1 ATP-binding cassette domain-containing protein [Kofleriaceae bacterium]MBP9204302.1 ATP-binding cassette domain-containing protein [Kofleriaceae bacterium]